MSLQDQSPKAIQFVSGSPTTTFIYPNQFELRLPVSGFRTFRDEVCLKSLTMYYSFFNVSAAKGNNSFSYTWPDGNGTYPVVLADGCWSFANIFTYLQNVMSTNGHFLLDPIGNSIFYITLVVNPTLYAISLIVTPLPSSLPVGWSNPGGINLASAAGKGPQLKISPGIVTLMGFPSASYPAAPSSSVFALNSGIPQITDVTSLNLMCNLVDNTGFTLTPGVLSSFVMQPGQLPGTLINREPTNPDWLPIQAQQTYQTVTVSLVDQLLRPVIIQDPSGCVITLNVRKRS